MVEGGGGGGRVGGRWVRVGGRLEVGGRVGEGGERAGMFMECKGL